MPVHSSRRVSSSNNNNKNWLLFRFNSECDKYAFAVVLLLSYPIGSTSTCVCVCKYVSAFLRLVTWLFSFPSPPLAYCVPVHFGVHIFFLFLLYLCAKTNALRHCHLSTIWSQFQFNFFFLLFVAVRSGIDKISIRFYFFFCLVFLLFVCQTRVCPSLSACFAVSIRFWSMICSKCFVNLWNSLSGSLNADGWWLIGTTTRHTPPIHMAWWYLGQAFPVHAFFSDDRPQKYIRSHRMVNAIRRVSSLVERCAFYELIDFSSGY